MASQSSERHATQKARWRFGLGGLFGCVTLICVWLTMMSLRTTERSIDFHCGSLPPNDHALIAWFQRQEGTRDVSAARESDIVTVQIRKHEFFATFAGASPPLSWDCASVAGAMADTKANRVLV